MKSMYTSYGYRPVSIVLESLDGDNCDFINVCQILIPNQGILSESNNIYSKKIESNWHQCECELLLLLLLLVVALLILSIYNLYTL